MRSLGALLVALQMKGDQVVDQGSASALRPVTACF